MKLLAVIEDKNKRLRAYLPAFMSPFRACMTRYCSVHDVPNFANNDTYICYHEIETGSGSSCNYVSQHREDVSIVLLLESDIEFVPPGEGVEQPNVALTEDGRLVLTVSIGALFKFFGKRDIQVGTSWDAFLGSYTQEQLLQAVVQMPYPAVTASLCGASTKGMTEGDVADPESPDGIHWQFPNGDTYLDFGLIYKRPQAYTLDNIPGLTAHFGSLRLPGILDSQVYGHSLTDVVVESDISCPVNLSKSIPVVNGLMYIPTVDNNLMYIQSAAELFWNGTYQSSAVMLMDYSEILGDEELQVLKLSDCTLISAKFNGKDYILTVKLPVKRNDPDYYSNKLKNNTMFTVLDGRLMTFDRIRMISTSTIAIYLDAAEIRHMRERDMQLTGNVEFNEFAIKLVRSHIEWLEAQFIKGTDDASISALKAAESEDSVNQNRSFFYFLPGKDIYINEYTVDDRLNYNGLIIHGNIAGMLQSCKGLEIFEHVILNYMDIRVLKHATGEKPDLVYGSDAHVLGYAPYNYLTTLEKYTSDIERQSDISLEAMPFVDRRAPEAVVPNTNRFKLLDVVKLK